MDNTAIKQIQESSGIPELIEQLGLKNTKFPTMVLPESYRIADLEKYMPKRSSYRVNYETISKSAFVDYCLLENTTDNKCFIDTENMRAITHFDLGTKEQPLHRLHTATLTPRKTAAYKALLAFASMKRSQQETADFIEDWANSITVADEFGSDMSIVDACRAVKTITIERIQKKRSSAGSFSESLDLMEQAEAKADKAPMPAKIIFQTEPYLDFEQIIFVLDVSINTNDHERYVKFGFRIIKHDLIKEEIGEEFLDTLEKSFKKTIPTFIGSI